MTTDQADWRLLNYDGHGEMLNGKEFELKTFHGKGPNDHEHCILCWQTISDAAGSGDDAEGYCCYNAQTKQFNWICKRCFDAFQVRFAWKAKNR